MPADVQFDVRSIEDRSTDGGPTRPRAARDARAIVRTAVRFGKIRRRVTAWLDLAGVNARRWWVWTDRPLSLRAIWRQSDLDPSRVYKDSPALRSAWWWANHTERPMLFVLIVLAPGFLQPLLRWVFVRPTRRAGFWLVVVALLLWRLAAWAFTWRTA